VDDPCLIHGAHECAANSFCSWDRDSATCHEKPADPNAGAAGCANGEPPTRFQNGRFVAAEPHQCQRLVHERVLVEHVADDPATMFYHWWRYFKEVSGKVASQGAADKLTHFFVDRPPNTQFFHYFGLLSKFCWRRTSAIPDGTCFCAPPLKGNVGESGSHAVLEHMLSELGIDAAPPTRVRVSGGVEQGGLKKHVWARPPARHGPGLASQRCVCVCVGAMRGSRFCSRSR
jgi:hypothetical protein